MNPILTGLLRHLLTTLGGAIAAKGYLDESLVGEIVGAILTLLGAGWSIAHKRLAAKNTETTKRFPFSVLFAFFCGQLVLCGCASINQSLRTETRQTNGVVEIRETRSRAVALWDAKQTVEKLRISSGKTHSIGLSGVESEAASTNMAWNLKALTDLLNAVK